MIGASVVFQAPTILRPKQGKTKEVERPFLLPGQPLSLDYLLGEHDNLLYNSEDYDSAQSHNYSSASNCQGKWHTFQRTYILSSVGNRVCSLTPLSYHNYCTAVWGLRYGVKLRRSFSSEVVVSYQSRTPVRQHTPKFQIPPYSQAATRTRIDFPSSKNPS